MLRVLGHRAASWCAFARWLAGRAARPDGLCSPRAPAAGWNRETRPLLCLPLSAGCAACQLKQHNPSKDLACSVQASAASSRQRPCARSLDGLSCYDWHAAQAAEQGRSDHGDMAVTRPKPSLHLPTEPCRQPTRRQPHRDRGSGSAGRAIVLVAQYKGRLLRPVKLRDALRIARQVGGGDPVARVPQALRDRPRVRRWLQVVGSFRRQALVQALFDTLLDAQPC